MPNIQDRYRQLVELSPEGILIVADGHIVFANPAGAEILGAPGAEEIAGISWLKFFPPDKRTSMQNHMARLSQRVESRIIRWDGSRAVVELSMAPALVHGCLGVQVVFRDITLRRKADEKRKLHRTQLRNLAWDLSELAERERYRIAKVLHDTLGTQFAFSRIKLSEASRRADPLEIRNLLKEIDLLMDQAIRTMRNFTAELSCPVLYELGLPAALEELADKLEREERISVRIEDDGTEKPLNRDLGMFLYRCAHDLILHVIQQRECEKARIILRRDKSMLQLSVASDGPEKNGEKEKEGHGHAENCRAPKEHGGIFSIREHLLRYGGRLLIRSDPSLGACAATITVPLDLE